MVEDMGDGMQCINHPFTKNPGGICALCLQEKLGKLVTSSFPLPKHLSSSSSSSSPSLRSDSASKNNSSKLPFLLAASSSTSTANIVYKRSQSTRTTTTAYGDSDFSPRKPKGFWSFLHLHSSKHHSTKKVGSFHNSRQPPTCPTETTVAGSSTSSSSSSSMSYRAVTEGVTSSRSGIHMIVEEDGSPNVVIVATPSQSKVSRSRSVGCGSRSFSGDFFERITNGFGDCTLRRVESQREGSNNKGKFSSSRNGVRCGGIFGGFMIMTSSSCSSSSSSWVSSSSTEHHHNNMTHGGRHRSWGWAFASPMRAFTWSSSSCKRGRTISDSTIKNTTPNLDVIPSLLAVSI